MAKSFLNWRKQQDDALYGYISREMRDRKLYQKDIGAIIGESQQVAGKRLTHRTLTVTDLRDIFDEFKTEPELVASFFRRAM